MSSAKTAYYSDPDRRPAALTPITAGIPSELRALPRWVGWRFEWRDGEKRWTKVPLNLGHVTTRGYERARSNQPRDWAGFDRATAELAKPHGTLDGIGFVFAPDGDEFGLDLDDCRNLDTGELTPVARDILARFPTYAEVSPSGTGVKAVGLGRLPGGKGKRSAVHNVEVYDRGRFFVLTGHRLPDAPSKPCDCRNGLDWFLPTFFPDSAKSARTPRVRTHQTPSPPAAHPPGLGDEWVIERLTRSGTHAARNRQLWDGDWKGAGYGSQSEADLALCGQIAFYTGPDANRIDAVFRRSKLYRGKWERDDYRGDTIARALSGRTEFNYSTGVASKRPAPARFRAGQRVRAADRDNIGTVTDRRDDGLYLVEFVGKDGIWEGEFHKDDLSPLTSRNSPPVRPQPPRPFVPFPVALLPQPIAEFVTAVSRALPCDPAYVALPVLATLAASVGLARVLRIKRSWTEPPVVWAAVVGFSGTVKSPAEEHATRPLVELEDELGRQHDTAQAKYRADLDEYKAAVRKAREGGDESDLTPPTRPAAKRVMVSDATIEALGAVLHDNPKGVLVRRDELRGWFGSFTRYSKASDEPQWLQLHRAGQLVIDRKTADKFTIRVPHAAASVCGGIQPDILAGVLTTEAFASGLAARLLLVLPPREAKRWTDDDLDAAVEAEYRRIVRALFALEPGGASGTKPVEVSLTDEARGAFAAFVNQWGQKTCKAGERSAAAFSKLEGYAARFALIHHLVRVTAGEIPDGPVGLESVEAGVGLARWFADESERVYAMLGEDEPTRELRELAESIDRRGGRISARDLQRQNSRKYRTSAEAEGALNELVAAGWGNWGSCAPERGGHPIRQFVLCPPGSSSADGDGIPGSCADTRPLDAESSGEIPDESDRVSEVSCVGSE